MHFGREHRRQAMGSAKWEKWCILTVWNAAKYCYELSLIIFNYYLSKWDVIVFNIETDHISHRKQLCIKCRKSYEILFRSKWSFVWWYTIRGKLNYVYICFVENEYMVLFKLKYNLIWINFIFNVRGSNICLMFALKW